VPEELNPEAILQALPEGPVRQLLLWLLNRGEELEAENAALRAENQRLKDEINRLKGEHGARPQGSSKAPPTNHSSEKERRTPKDWRKRPKLAQIGIDRTVRLPVAPGILPPDAQFKGYDPVVVQDLVLKRDNVRFLKAKFYSPTTGQTYLASLPPGYDGEFGPGIRSLCLSLAYGCHVSLPLIHTFLTNAGSFISRGEVVNLVTQRLTVFHAEKAAVLEAGLRSSPWQHFDTTYTPVNGVSHACHVLGNPLFSIYQTTRHQDRGSVLDVLRGGAPRIYRLDGAALSLLEEAKLPAKVRARLTEILADTTWSEAGFVGLLAQRLPRLGRETRQQILEAAAVAAYRAEAAQGGWPVVRCLVCDDAGQLRGLTEEIALCWVHDARHYKKLVPRFTWFQHQWEAFRKEYWTLYRELQAYRSAPSLAEAERLERRFDALFATETLYADLDRCIARTRANKEKLLRVLKHPELPLHNNPAELAARRRVRKRHVSFGPRSEAGRQAWDTFQSLAATTAKLGISFFEYLKDRVSAAGQVPPLAQVIAERAEALQLGASWHPC
jgi:hypothetical protein